MLVLIALEAWSAEKAPSLAAPKSVIRAKAGIR
jgi:hypothetical protein